MKQLEPDLWQTSTRPISERANTHAYLLTRPQGNLLIYSVGDDQGDDLDQIEQLGGVQMQLLSHRDESGPWLNDIRARYDCRLACSAGEASAVAEHAAVDLIVDPDCDESDLDGLEILATPGHTAGDISFRYRSPHGKTYLFTGDVVFPDRGGWGVFVFEAAGGDAGTLERSLEQLRDVDPDLVLSSASVGEPSVVSVSGEQWTTAVDQRIERLRDWAAARA